MYPEEAEMVKVWFEPYVLDTAPVGEMLPPMPAEAVRVYEQFVFAGGVEEHEPLHWIAPFTCVWPQTFAVEVQAVP